MTANESEPTDPELKLSQEYRQMVGALPDDQRAVIQLRVVEGRTTPETAAVLGITPARVRETQHVALQALRELARNQRP
jgi:RNA polymerase sigma-70 factor (ECF subfamily)